MAADQLACPWDGWEPAAIEFCEAGLNGRDLSFDPVLSLQHIQSFEVNLSALGSGSGLVCPGINQAGPFGQFFEAVL